MALRFAGVAGVALEIGHSLVIQGSSSWAFAPKKELSVTTRKQSESNKVKKSTPKQTSGKTSPKVKQPDIVYYLTRDDLEQKKARLVKVKAIRPTVEARVADLQRQFREAQEEERTLNEEEEKLLVIIRNARLKELMTAGDLQRLQQRLATLQDELRVLRTYKGGDAIHQGDTWHDNPTFYQAEAQERTLMQQIAECDEEIRRAHIVTTPERTDCVNIGSLVRVCFVDEPEETLEYRILREMNKSGDGRTTSYKSPLGQALLDRSVGEIVAYQAGEQTYRVKILAISHE